MNDVDRHHHQQQRAPRVAVRRLTPSQVAGGVGGAVAIALAAVAAALLLVASTARAQPLSAQEVLDALEQRAATLRDIAFVLEGELRDESGQRYAVEVEVLAIPRLQVASLYIIQPDALADNMVIVAGDEVRNYTFLTNQVALYDIDDPDAFGGLVQGGESLALDLDLASVFAGWEVRIAAHDAGSEGDVYTLRFDNLDPLAMIHHAIVVLDASEWLPLRLAFYTSEEERFADLRLIGVEVDSGLDADEVTWVPSDAEVLDRRR